MPRSRDRFLDGLRTLAILRVVALHVCLRVELPAVVAFSFVFPGMPLVFFVSGAAAAWSLGAGDPPARLRFWSSRARRLLVPYWGLGAVLVGLAIALDARHEEAYYALRPASVANWILPLSIPHLSPALDKLAGHLWFLSALLLLLAGAPWMLALHRRRPFAGALGFAAAGVGLELALLAWPGLAVPGLVRHTLLFGAAFQLGFGEADGVFARLERGTFLWAALLLSVFALSFHDRVAPGTALHAVPLAHVALGLAVIALCLGFRAAAQRCFASRGFARVREFVNPRAFTIFLWGPVANEIGWRACALLGWSSFVAYALLALGALAAIVLLGAPLEAWAARRGRVLRGPGSERAPERREAA